MIKVLIVDDEKILRESLKHIIEQDPEIQVIGCAKNGAEAARICSETPPDLVLMDLFMPECDGATGTELIKTQNDAIKVLMLTTYYGDENISQAIRNGADGYILKDIEPEQLILAMKSVSKGMGVFHPPVIKNLQNKIENEETANTKLSDVKLTDRERSILELIVEGKDNKEISEVLFLSEGTVANIISNMLKSLNFKNRINLAVFAVKNKLV